MGGYSTCIYTDFDEHTKRLDAKHAIGSVKDQNFDASWTLCSSSLGQTVYKGRRNGGILTDTCRAHSKNHAFGTLPEPPLRWLPDPPSRAPHCEHETNFARDLQERLGILALLALPAPFRICKLQIPFAARETDPVSGHHKINNLQARQTAITFRNVPTARRSRSTPTPWIVGEYGKVFGGVGTRKFSRASPDLKGPNADSHSHHFTEKLHCLRG
jgi:hypothetical protein